MDNPHHDYYTPSLRDCITTAPRLLGCEASYLFPLDLDVCGAPSQVEREEEERDEQEEENEEISRVPAGVGVGRGAGNLVVHVRSGDIFDNSGKDYSGQASVFVVVTVVLFFSTCDAVEFCAERIVRRWYIVAICDADASVDVISGVRIPVEGKNLLLFHACFVFRRCKRDQYRVSKANSDDQASRRAAESSAEPTNARQNPKA